MKTDTQTKIFIFLERLWLVAAILSIGCVAYFIITGDNDSALFFFGFFVLCGLLYILRKKQRVRHQNQLNQGNTYEPGKK
jgi:LPXTG-motif cell wall-anchored protein